VKKLFSYFLVLLSIAAWAQKKDEGNSLKLPFQDSLRIVLENTKNTDATAVGAGFSRVWTNLSLDQQQIIRKQVKAMKKKGYKLRPHLQNYLGAITDAVNIESIDPVKLSNFLAVTQEVITNEDQAKGLTFLKNSREFFQHHALHYDRSFRLYARDDNYRFEYIKAVSDIPTATDTTSSDKNPLDQLNETNETNWQDPPPDTVPAPKMEVWMQLSPQPVLSGPILKFEKVSFNFSTPYDSAFLKNTKGSVSLINDTFVGNGGSFDWSSAGLSADSVFYELKDYNFKVNKPMVKAEQGMLTYRGKVNGKVDGIFEFKSIKHKDDASATYPRFMSFKSNIPILGLGDDKLKYQGGFALNGRQIFSSSVSNENAKLEVFGESDKKFEVVARQFEFKDSIILTHNGRVEIFQGNDSIFHPSLQMRYHYGKKRLSLQRGKGLLKDAPYSSTFFNIDFDADFLRWDLKSDSMNLFTAGSRSQAPMIIESADFFDPEDYRLLGGMSAGFTFHPLGLVASYSIRTGIKEFYADDLAIATGKNPQEVRMAMAFLADKGMIDYDPAWGRVRTKTKTIHTYDANKNESDYDNLKIHSVVDGPPNATLNFPKGYLVVRGVDEFNVSDSLNVIIKPDSSTITLLKDRDIKFSGKITAGNFEINGREFMLKYDSFFISLKHIDSIRFYVTEINARGQKIRRRVSNSMVGTDSTAAAAGGLQGISETSGTLYINHPDNKSGRQKFSDYPRLDASSGGVIYFDRPEVLDGAYDRSVFFVVPPFKLDSLSDADPASIHFDGTFVSSGMFPSFKEKLHTMHDKSLGFTHPIPQSGYPLYNTEGVLYGGMSLDHAGIRANGHIDYLAASVESGDFVFYPDSVIARGEAGEIKEKQFGSVWFPQAVLSEYNLLWFPKQDKFKVHNLRGPFEFYNATAQFNGSLTVSKAGVSGDGTLDTRGSEVVSTEMNFSAKDFGARHAHFEVKTTNPDKPALSGDDIRLKFFLDENYADINPEIQGEAAFDFPYAQFKTSITDARWDLNTQKISMAKDKDTPIEDSYFYTTRKDLDSLVFNAEKAEYDINSQQLKVSGIPFIVVADAKITPENNEVLILENAKIGQLKNTTIILDTLDGYHRLTDGVVDIISRKEFAGYATYQYVNAVNDTFAIKMTDFHLEPINKEGEKSRKRDQEIVAAQQTVADGTVSEKDKIILAPRIFYKGDMVMYATRPALQLRGYIKLDLKKIKNYNTWLRYEQSGDEKEVYMDFDNSVTEEGRRGEAGLHFSTDNSLYITFMSEKKQPDDENFFLPSGSLFYDKESQEFRIEDRQKAAGEKLSGKVLAYNEDKQEVRFEGTVNFFKGLKGFNFTSTALGSGNLETNDIKMNSFIMADMNIPPTAFDAMARDIQEVIKNEGAAEGLGDHTELLYKIGDIVGEKVVKDYEQKSLQNYVSLATIPQLVKPIVFSQVNLKWSQKAKAFYSEGTLGISNINKNDINGAFEGFMEIRKNEDGSPVFHVFIKVSPESWYYFGFEDNRLMVHSSNQSFNTIISKKSNAAKAKVGELVFIPGSDDETLSFINRFRKNYYEIETSYDLGGATSSKKKEKKEETEDDDGF
jgi:hypothetical protein